MPVAVAAACVVAAAGCVGVGAVVVRRVAEAVAVPWVAEAAAVRWVEGEAPVRWEEEEVLAPWAAEAEAPDRICNARLAAAA